MGHLDERRTRSSGGKSGIEQQKAPFANNTPAVDQKPEPESDRGTLVKDTNAVSRGDSSQSVESDNYYATSDSQVARRPGVEGFEDRRASGFNRVAGRHIAADGLVSRKGYLRIASGYGSDCSR
jgi:hypothetical protein